MYLAGINFSVFIVISYVFLIDYILLMSTIEVAWSKTGSA